MVFFVGCASTPRRTPEEHLQALKQLVRSGDEGQLRKYFETYQNTIGNIWYVHQECGEVAKQVGIPLGDCNLITQDDLLTSVHSSEENLRKQMKMCGTDADCLGDISVFLGPGTGFKKAKEKYSKIKQPNEQAGDDFWVSSDLAKQWNALYVQVAEQSGKKAEIRKKQNDEADARRLTLLQKFNEEGCDSLNSFMSVGWSVVQRLAPSRYEIATSGSTGPVHCMENGGGCYGGVHHEGQHAILITHETTFNSERVLPQLFVKKLKPKKMKLKNGFLATYQVFEESALCKSLTVKPENGVSTHSGHHHHNISNE